MTWLERGRADTLTLESAVDHESPQRRLGMRRRNGPERLVVKHDEPRRDVIDIDGPIPRLGTEQRLGERNSIAGHKTLLFPAHREARNLTNRIGVDLVQRDEMPGALGQRRLAKGHASCISAPRSVDEHGVIWRLRR